MAHGVVPESGRDLGGERAGAAGDCPLQIFRWRGWRCFYPPQYLENVIAICHKNEKER